MDANKLNIMQLVAQQEQARLDGYARYKDYYDGKHPLKVPEKYKEIAAQEYDIRANYCDVVVNALVSRLKIEGIKCSSENQALADECEGFIDRAWKANRMDAKHSRINRGAVKCGDSFVQVWPKFVAGSDKPVGYQISYIDPSLVFPFYSSDDDDSLEWVKKQWIAFDSQGAPYARKDIYYADRIERFYAVTSDTAPTLARYAGMQWQPYTEDGFEAQLINPYGIIPIVHLRNRQDESPFGASELENALTLQDAINKAVIDLMRIADAQGFPQRYITGADTDMFPKDANGEPIVLSGPAKTWLLPIDATAGEFGEANPTGALDTINKLIDRLCEVTRTPRSAMSTDAAGTASSGFALQKIEGPLIDKALECQTTFGNAYEDICRLLLIMGQYHGELSGADVEIDCMWNGIMTKSPTDEYQEAQTIALLLVNKVISIAEAQRKLGYTPKEIESMAKELEEEANKAEAALLGHAFDNTQDIQQQEDQQTE